MGGQLLPEELEHWRAKTDKVKGKAASFWLIKSDDPNRVNGIDVFFDQPPTPADATKKIEVKP